MSSRVTNELEFTEESNNEEERKKLMTEGKITEMSERFELPDNEAANSDKAERVYGSESGPLLTSEGGGPPRGLILSTGNQPSPANSAGKKSEYRKTSLIRRRSTRRLKDMKEGHVKDFTN